VTLRKRARKRKRASRQAGERQKRREKRSWERAREGVITRVKKKVEESRRGREGELEKESAPEYLKPHVVSASSLRTVRTGAHCL